MHLNREAENMRVDEFPSSADDEKSPFSSPHSLNSSTSSPRLTRISQEREQSRDNSKGRHYK